MPSEMIEAPMTGKIIEQLNSGIDEIDAIIISDYGKGLITTALIKGILAAAVRAAVPVVVDPQIGHFFEYKNVTSVTPNVKEAGAALGINIIDKKSLLDAGHKLLGMLECDSVLITRGDRGMSLFLKDGQEVNVSVLGHVGKGI